MRRGCGRQRSTHARETWAMTEADRSKRSQKHRVPMDELKRTVEEIGLEVSA
jgi:hypothetical protein